MTDRDFRFGLNMLTSESRTQWQDSARRVEDLGYDVLLVPDHLGMPAPFPALVSAAQATSRLRLGTYVLNVGFYQPALLARDAAATDQLTDGRLELGLGAGYVKAEFEAAELPFPGAGQRVDRLEHTVTEVRRLLADPEHEPSARQQPVPLMIAGQGDRVLTLAAQHAEIVGIAGVRTSTDPGRPDALAERIEFLRAAAGDRFAALELNLLILAVYPTGSDESNLAVVRGFYPDLSKEQLLELPGVLHGTEDEIAETLRHYRDTYGLTYFTALTPHLEAFGKVIARLR